MDWIVEWQNIELTLACSCISQMGQLSSKRVPDSLLKSVFCALVVPGPGKAQVKFWSIVVIAYRNS